MPGTFIEGRIGVTPLDIATSMTLGDLRGMLVGQLYTGEVGDPGWGSIDDSPDRLGKRWRSRPPGGLPVYIKAPRRGPERVEARLYFDRLDSRLKNQADSDIDESYLYVSDAIDVVFTEAESGLAALASSSNVHDVRRFVLPMVVAACEDGSAVRVGRKEGDVDPDLPLWLIHRFNASPQLTGDIKLVDLRGVNTLDARDRPSRMLRELLISRPVLQAAITEPGVQFGSIKLAVYDGDCRVSVDFELRADGGFTVSRSYTEYDDGSEPTHADFGRAISDDLAFSIAPRIESAHRRDRAWHTGGRAQFLADARALLRAI